MRTRLRRETAVAGGIVALVAIGVRLPMVLAIRPLDYDDGVYAMSVMAMRNGARPFRDIFSSQGPAFLPTLRVFDIIGLERPWAPRLAMLAAAAAIAIAVFAIACRLTTTAAAVAIGIAGLTGSAMMLASGPLQSDGIALAFAAAAFAVALRKAGGRGTSIAVGVLAALALATKSLLALPAVVAAVFILWRRRSRAAVGVAAASGLATGLVVTLPFGLADVWNQYVLFHLANPREIDPGESLRQLVTELVDRDSVVAGLAVLGVAWLLATYRSRERGDRTLISAAWLWLAGSVAVAVFSTDLNPGNLRFIAFAVVPILVLVAAARMPEWLVITAVAVLLPLHLAGDAGTFDGRELTPEETQLLALMETIPDGAQVVGDVPAITYAAGLRAPDWLTDTSYARVRAGYLTVDEVMAEIADGDTCAVVLWSGRLASLPADLAATSAYLGYTNEVEFGDGHVMLRRPSCTVPTLQTITARQR